MCRIALGRNADVVVFAPGRIEVLGKHTDYAGGRSLLAAVDRGFTVAAAARDDDRVTIMDVATSERAELPVRGNWSAASAWVRYPDTVLRRINRNFPDARGGADIAFVSDLPVASGLSSSSAFVVAVFMVLAELRGIAASAAYSSAISSTEDLAGYLGAMENGFDFGPLPSETGVGTQGGSEDHTAILCARPDTLVQYSFLPVVLEREIAMPDDYVFVVGSSGVRAEKAGAAMASYNAMAEQTRRLVELWRGAGAGNEPTLGAVIASDPDAALKLRSIVSARGGGDSLLERLAQFAAETDQIIPAAARALASGDIAGFGSHVDRSQHLAEHALHNQIPETIALARDARSLGAHAASAFGAGFGGSVWSLVRRADAPAFATMWRERYVASFPQHTGSAAFFITPASGAAHILT
jgi:galactokinase